MNATPNYFPCRSLRRRRTKVTEMDGIIAGDRDPFVAVIDLFRSFALGVAKMMGYDLAETIGEGTIN
jgi:hypothetical protein